MAKGMKEKLDDERLSSHLGCVVVSPTTTTRERQKSQAAERVSSACMHLCPVEGPELPLGHSRPHAPSPSHSTGPYASCCLALISALVLSNQWLCRRPVTHVAGSPSNIERSKTTILMQPATPPDT
jgi:hypothetical protein